MEQARIDSRTARRQRGVTLVESLIGLAVAGVLAGAAAPGFEQLRQRRHFEGAVAQLETDLHLARSEAVAQNRSVRISFRADEAGSCYVIHTGAADACRCDATGAAQCVSGQLSFRSVRFAGNGPIRLQANVPSILFDAHLGTVTPTGTMKLVGPDGRAVHVIINLLGRVRSCSPGGAVAGQPKC